MICTNKFDMCKSNNKSIYHHALFLFGMAINGFTMAIIKQKKQSQHMHYFLGLFYLCGPSALNAMIRPNAIWALELRFFFFCGRCCLTKLKKLKVYKTNETDGYPKLT